MASQSNLLYVVLNHKCTPDEPSTFLQGIYTKLGDIPPVDHNNSLLPMIIQCHPGQVLDLQPLQHILENVHCGDIPETDDEAKEFVADTIQDIACSLSPIFPHTELFYGILGTPTTTKMVAMDWTPTPGAKYHTFVDFAHAFIYVLSGGNEGLIKLGLRGWVARRFETPGVTSPRPFGRLRAGLFLGGGVTTFEDLRNHPHASTPNRRRNKGKGKMVAQTEAMENPSIPGSFTFSTDHLPQSGHAAMEEEGGSTPMPKEEEDPTAKLTPKEEEKSTTMPQFIQGRAPASESTPPSPDDSVNLRALPDYIIPPDHLLRLEATEGHQAFIARHLPHAHSYITTRDIEAQTLNGPLPLGEYGLHPLMPFYLRTHGWPERVVNIVAIAHSCEASFDGFLKTMAKEGMAVAEASFLWHSLRWM